MISAMILASLKTVVAFSLLSLATGVVLALLIVAIDRD